MTISTANRSVAIIVRVVAEHFDISEALILSGSHERRAAWPRFVCMGLAHEIARLSAKDIGRKLGRDRSTVENGCRRLQRLVQTVPDIGDAVRALRPRCHEALDDDAVRWTLRQRALDLFNELAEGVAAQDEVDLIQRVARLAAEPSAPCAATEPPWGFGPTVEAATPESPAPVRPARSKRTAAANAKVGCLTRSAPAPAGKVGSDWGRDSASTASALEQMNALHLQRVVPAGGFGGARA